LTMAIRRPNEDALRAIADATAAIRELDEVE
jgi:hypothetical protein